MEKFDQKRAFKYHNEDFDVRLLLNINSEQWVLLLVIETEIKP